MRWSGSASSSTFVYVDGFRRGFARSIAALRSQRRSTQIHLCSFGISWGCFRTIEIGYSADMKTTRRRFVHLMGASGAAAALSGCESATEALAALMNADPVMRHVVGGRAVDRTAASTSQVGRFETDVLTHPDNLAALMAMPGQWVDRIRQRRPMKKLILDLDSSVSQTYGRRERAGDHLPAARRCRRLDDYAGRGRAGSAAS